MRWTLRTGFALQFLNVVAILTKWIYDMFNQVVTQRLDCIFLTCRLSVDGCSYKMTSTDSLFAGKV